MTARARPSRIGELVGGKYRVTRFLAEGGMGAVHEAQHVVVRRPFAVKFLHADLAANREILTRFQREAEAAGALQSENVAAVLDFGIAADGTPYIVMEYLAGESLAALLERLGRLPVARAADICLQACRGMEAAHAAGIVHRDLKPHNLFVCRRADGTDLVKVLDFGVAKLHGPDAAGGPTSGGTGTGTVLGTPLYMSPEQARGDKAIDHRTDIYALGAILYEMLSGQRPHPGDSHNAILFHISTQPPVPLESGQPGLMPALREMIESALSSDARARPATARVFAQALASIARREVWPDTKADEERARRALDVSTMLSPEHPLRAPLAPPPPAGRPRARARLLAGAIGAVLAVALVMNVRRAPRSTRSAARPRALDPGASLFVPGAPAAALQQIAALRTHATGDAARLDTMVATPSAVWFTGSSPHEVGTAVHNTIVQARRGQQVPVLVAFNHPYLDCSGYGLPGAADTAAYQEWIDAFAAGIGNESAIVILEPNSLGQIPYESRADGTSYVCRPTVTDERGARVPAPGADAASRFAQINHAVDVLAGRAPHAAVYLDGTHPAWLSAGEIARRLVQAGVARSRGFFVNVGNYQSTSRSIDYGTAISQRIHDAGGAARTPFVIDTARNGTGPFDAPSYAAPPFNQPPAVIAALAAGAWCSPPGAGIGLRPTTRTGVALVDALLWVGVPGRSSASCDILGGARAWDYSRYNPWGIVGDARDHFDPLWGMVDPAENEWFPEQALQLARNANPPLVESEPPPAPVASTPVPARPAPPPASRRVARQSNVRVAPQTVASLAPTTIAAALPPPPPEVPAVTPPPLELMPPSPPPSPRPSSPLIGRADTQIVKFDMVNHYLSDPPKPPLHK